MWGMVACDTIESLDSHIHLPYLYRFNTRTFGAFGVELK